MDHVQMDYDPITTGVYLQSHFTPITENAAYSSLIKSIKYFP